MFNEMKLTIGRLLGALIVALLVLGSCAGAAYLTRARWLPFLDRPMASQVLATGSVDWNAAGTQIAEVTLTPGPAGGQQIATLVPTPVDLYSYGDVTKLRDLLQSKGAVTDTFHFDAVGYVGNADVAWYCSRLAIADPRDVSKPLVLNVPLTEYGSAVAAFVDINAGVVSADLRNIETTDFQRITMQPLDRQDQFGQPYQEHIDGVQVTLYARWGILSAAPRAGNQTKLTIKGGTLDEVVQGVTQILKALAPKLFPEYPVELRSTLQRQRDGVDNAALELSTLQAIAPVQPDGSRDMQYLELARKTVEFGLNTPGQQAYDDLLKDVEPKAREAGFQGPVTLRVIVSNPDKFYYLHGLENDVLTPVIPENWQALLGGSTCPDYQLPQDQAETLIKQALPSGISVLPWLGK